MSQTTVLLFLVGLLIAGILRVVGRLLQVRQQQRFTEIYLSKYRELVQADTSEGEPYNWLVHRSTKMQAQLGSLGLTAREATPYELNPIANQPLLINALSEIRSGTARPGLITAGEDALVRHQGVLADTKAAYLKHLLNPVVWLGEGVRLLVLLPLLIFQWLGLLNANAVERLGKSTTFNGCTGLLAVLVLAVAGLVLVLGWQGFNNLLAQWFGALL